MCLFQFFRSNFNTMSENVFLAMGLLSPDNSGMLQLTMSGCDIVSCHILVSESTASQMKWPSHSPDQFLLRMWEEWTRSVRYYCNDSALITVKDSLKQCFPKSGSQHCRDGEYLQSNGGKQIWTFMFPLFVSQHRNCTDLSLYFPWQIIKSLLWENKCFT